MRHPRHPFVKTAAALVLAAAVIGASTSAAFAAPAATSETAAANLLGTLAYRGAEHPYNVGNAADAAALHGVSSAQAVAARTVLAANTAALTDALGGTAASDQRTAIGTALSQRDAAELAFAAASTPGHISTSGQSGALRSLATAESGMVAALSARLGNNASTLATNLSTVDSGATTQLKDVVGGTKARFSGALKAADLSSGFFTALASQAARVSGLAGDVTASGAVYRSNLTTAFTEHVLQTGLLAEGILLSAGTYSDQALAAFNAEDGNSQRIAVLLGSPVQKVNEDLAAWRSHINSGYGNYINYIFSYNNRKLLIKANDTLNAYVQRISKDVNVLAPSVPVATLAAEYTDHTTGTEKVIDALNAGSPTVYGIAAEGTMHFAMLAQTIAAGAVAAGNV